MLGREEEEELEQIEQKCLYSLHWQKMPSASLKRTWQAKVRKANVTRGKVNAFELRGCENSVSLSQSEQKAFVFELSNDLLIGQSAVRLSNRKHSLSFQPH